MASLNSLLSGGVKGVQRGVLTFAGAAGTTIVNVSPVNPAKAVLILCGNSYRFGDSAPMRADQHARLELINGSQIQATRALAGINTDGYWWAWQLVEYY